MKKLNIDLKIKSTKNQTNSIRFVAPSELLLSGFKFSYVTPIEIEQELLKTLNTDSRYKNTSKNDCIEETLLSCPTNYFNIEGENSHLEVYWV